MSKQKTNKRSTHQGAGTSTDKQLRELDAELSRRLDATLDAHAKFELEAMRVLAILAPLEEGSSSSREEAARPGERQDSVQSPLGDAKTAHSTTGADGPIAEVLAKIVFKDGDAFHFLGVPPMARSASPISARGSVGWQPSPSFHRPCAFTYR